MGNVIDHRRHFWQSWTPQIRFKELFIAQHNILCAAHRLTKCQTHQSGSYLFRAKRFGPFALNWYSFHEAQNIHQRWKARLTIEEKLIRIGTPHHCQWAVKSHGSGSSDPAYPTNEITAVHLEAKCKSWMEPLWLGDVDALLKQVAS